MKTGTPFWFGFGLLFFLNAVAMVLGFYFFNDWKSQKDWSATVADLKAKGEPTCWQDVVPLLISDSDNFCATPLLTCKFNYSRSKESRDLVYSNPVLVEEIDAFKLNDQDLPDMPPLGSIQKNELTDLASWQAYFQKSKLFPRAPVEIDSPEAVLIALHRFQSELEELRTASLRPEARFQVHYEQDPKISILLPQLGFSMSLSQLLCLRSIALLHTGKTAEAWSDLAIVFKFHQALEKEPSLVSTLVGNTIVSFALSTIWEGMAINAWSNSELEKISKCLSQLDFLSEYRQSVQADVIFMSIPTFDYIKSNPSHFFEVVLDTPQHPDEEHLLYMIPQGFYDQAKTQTIRLLYDYGLPIIDIKNHRYDPAKADAAEKYQEGLHSYGPSNYILNLFLCPYKSHAQKAVSVQTGVDQARIACALEIYHHEKGQYPENLDALKQPLPNDIVSGKSYLYKPTPNRRYQIWGVGCNGKDEQGKVVFKNPEKQSLNLDQGDLVWAYPEKIPVP